MRKLLLLLALAFGGALWAHWPMPALPSGGPVDQVVINKGARTLTLVRQGAQIAEYPISLGRTPVGAKQQEGDGRTPEGQYRIDYRKTDSSFHLALHVSYPDPSDRAAAKALGVSPGGLIMVHGLPNGLGWIGRLHRLQDWTNGCIAVTNAEMEQIAAVVPDGTPVTIHP